MQYEGSSTREGDAEQANAEDFPRKGKRKPLPEVGYRIGDEAEEATACPPPVDRDKRHGPYQRECSNCCKDNWFLGSRAGSKGDVQPLFHTTISWWKSLQLEK